MTPEQTALVADLRERSRDEFAAGHNNDSVLHGNAADLIEAQAAELERLRAERDAAVERCAAWHEREAIGAMNSLHCGSENSEYRAANRLHDFHKPSADALRALKGGA